MKVPLRKRFGSRIRQLRQATGKSQEEFADLCGYARSYMSRVERGLANPSLDAVAVFAVALGVEVEELFRSVDAGSTPAKAKVPIIKVPFAKDGTCFNPTLRRPDAGTYTVGRKGHSVMFHSFNDALEYLKKMDCAYWQRPNNNGNWGVVVAVRWDTLPEKYLPL